MDDDAVSKDSRKLKLAGLYGQIDQLRDDIRDLHRRSEESASALLEIRDERAVLKERLDRLLMQVGAIAYDAGYLDDVASSQVSPSSQAVPEDESAGDASHELNSSPQDSETSSGAVDDAPPTGNSIVPEEDEEEAVADEPLGPSEGALEPDTHQPRQNTHEVYLTTAKLFPSIKSELGSPPSKIKSYADVVGELGMLHRAAQPEQLEMWAQLPDEIQRTLASYVAARVKHLQDEIDSSLSGLIADDDRVFDIFSRLHSHMKSYQPGYAHGLARDHAPENIRGLRMQQRIRTCSMDTPRNTTAKAISLELMKKSRTRRSRLTK